MKKRYFYRIIGLIILTFLVSCGGGGSSSSGSNDTSLVTITIGSNSQTASLRIEENTLFAQAKIFFKNLIKHDIAVAAIPSNVYKVVFTISASDMATITKEVLVSGQTSITETFSVPNGSNRYFLVEDKNISGNILHRGNTYANLDGTAVTLDIVMSDIDTTPPTVISTNPANGATGVVGTTAITITFSETIDAATFNSTTFTVKNGGSNVTGTITTSGSVVTFTPSTNLSYNTTYTATITTGVKDFAGNAMASNYTWTFTTGSALVGKWGSTVLEHANDGSWASSAGTIIFNSNGTGSNTYNINDNGTLSSKTEDFTYSTTTNSDGSMSVTQTYSNGTVTQRFVLSDDGNVFIEDGTDNPGIQKIMIGIKMDTSKNYSNADLNGNYYMMGYEHNGTYIAPPNGNGSYMAVSSIATLDGNGNFTDYFTANSDGTTWEDTGSTTYSVNSDGSFSMADALGYISGNGKVSVVSCPQRTDKWVDYIFMKKGDITYSAAGAAGTWAIVGFGDSSGTSFNADFGTLSCDSSGSCTYSFKNQTDGSITYPSGSFTISVASDGSMTTSFTSGAPSYAVAVGNNGNTIIVNDSLDQSSDPRKIYIGVRCNACSNLVPKAIRAAKR